MSHIAYWFRHSSDKLDRLADLLNLPVFRSLSRTAVVDRDRRTGHAEKTQAAMEVQLRAPRSQGIELDGGRGGGPNEQALFLFDRGADPYPAAHSGAIVLEYDSSQLDGYLDAFSRIAGELETVLAYISLEPSFSEAQSVTLGYEGQDTRRRKDMTPRRRRERKAQAFHIADTGRKLPAVHWGMYLSAGHLAALDLEQLASSSAFHRVEKLGTGLVFLQLTADPQDALRDAFEEKLQAARHALAPVLIDSSDIELAE